MDKKQLKKAKRKYGKRYHKNRPQPKPRQMDLGLPDPRGNRAAKVRDRVRKKFLLFETRRFVRSAEAWIFLGVAGSFVATQIYYIVKFYETLPPRIPLYINTIDLADHLGNKIEIILFPVLSGVIVFVALLAGYQLYNSRKELIVFSLISMAASVGLLTFALLRLLTAYI